MTIKMHFPYFFKNLFVVLDQIKADIFLDGPNPHIYCSTEVLHVF